MAIPFYLALRSLPNSLYLASVILIALASIWLCNKVSRDTHSHDHQGMCIDEFVGFFVTMFGAPQGWPWIVVGFLLFRLFDIWKPQPIRYCDEKITGGTGMILDDVLAGVYSCIILHLLTWII